MSPTVAQLRKRYFAVARKYPEVERIWGYDDPRTVKIRDARDVAFAAWDRAQIEADKAAKSPPLTG